MGNHVAGKSMGLAAELALKTRQQEGALELLDAICMPHRGCDAEFEAEDPARPGHVHPVIQDYTDPRPGAALGMLMLEAFAPNGLADQARYAPMFDGKHPDHELATDRWWDEVEKPFSQRYDFC